MDGESFYPQLKGETGQSEGLDLLPLRADERDGTLQGASVSCADRDWKLYETGELYDMNSDLDEELPIFESEDGPEAAAARAKLKPIFAEMVA